MQPEALLGTYQPPDGTSWYHFLYGDVPSKHTIDFIYRPVVPHAALTQRHFAHLSRVLNFLEPRAAGETAIAIANLSRDDTTHIPGRGGMAIIVCARVTGAKDNEGRPDPLFAHCLVCVDKRLSAADLLQVTNRLFSVVAGKSGGVATGIDFYREYRRLIWETPDRAPSFLESYVQRFAFLPALEDGVEAPGGSNAPISAPQILVIHDDGLDVAELAECGSRVAAALYNSDLRWTLVTTGRESGDKDGISVTFKSASDPGISEAPGVAPVSFESVPERAEEIHQFLVAPPRRSTLAAVPHEVTHAAGPSQVRGYEDPQISVTIADADIRSDIALPSAKADIVSAESRSEKRVGAAASKSESAKPLPWRMFSYGFVSGATFGVLVAAIWSSIFPISNNPLPMVPSATNPSSEDGSKLTLHPEPSGASSPHPSVMGSATAAPTATISSTGKPDVPVPGVATASASSATSVAPTSTKKTWWPKPKVPPPITPQPPSTGTGSPTATPQATVSPATTPTTPPAPSTSPKTPAKGAGTQSPKNKTPATSGGAQRSKESHD